MEESKIDKEGTEIQAKSGETLNSPQESSWSVKSPKCSKIARKSQKERKKEAKSTEKKRVDEENKESPGRLCGKEQEKVNTEKNQGEPPLKSNHQKQLFSVEDLCNEKDMSILWPLLGVNSRGEKGRDPWCPSAKRCEVCSRRCPERNSKPQCKACVDSLHRRGCNVREICEAARRATIRKKIEIIRSSGISSLEELKEKKLVTMSPYPPHRGSSQPQETREHRKPLRRKKVLTQTGLCGQEA